MRRLKTVGAVGLLAVCVAAGVPAQAASPLPVGQAVPTGFDTVVDAVPDGTVVLGTRGDGNAAWVGDIAAGTVLRRLPAGWTFEYFAISDGGQEVAYSRSRKHGKCRINEPWVRNVTSNKTMRVAASKAGKALSPRWKAKSCSRADRPNYRVQPQISAPAMSGDGRFVAFCANFAAARRVDLYVKDLTSGDLTLRRGLCQPARPADAEGWLLQAPVIDFDGSVVAVPGRYDSDADPASAQTVQLLLDRSAVKAGPTLPAAEISLTADGGTLLAVTPGSGEGDAPDPVFRYRLADGTVTQLPGADPGLVGHMANSDDGSLVAVPGERIFSPTQRRIYDRTTGQSTQLAQALKDGGVSAPYDEDHELQISPDGSVVFANSDEGEVFAMRWR